MSEDYKLKVQSEPVPDTDVPSEEVHQQEILVFEDEMKEDPVDYESLLDKTIDEDKDGTGHLARFLERPVLVNVTAWTQASMTNPVAEFTPWKAFFYDDLKIRAKIQNFSRVHSKLHLKFVLNASPFFYGAIRVAYFPLRSSIPSSSNPLDLVPASQTPGVWLTPQDMSSAELVLPYLNPSNWLCPLQTSDLSLMGTIRFYVYNQLASANGATGSSITISTYAWAEEVELAGPTAAMVQSKPKTEGKISGLADSVATVAGSLSKLPVIGGYASAAQMGATAIGKAAAMFGFSNNPNVKDPGPVVPKSFHAFANVETSMPIDKLSIDPENEVVVDNRVAGTDATDPLSLQNFMRESYFGQVSWASAMAPETNITTIGVTPGFELYSPTTNYTIAYHTPISYVARMFRYWRGSIIYRFKIIKTKYHKGRLRLSWDPQTDLTGIADSETTCFTKIVDLETDDEIEFEVPFKAQSIWNRTSTIPDAYWNTSSINATLDKCNGYLSVKVQNVLSTPTGSGTIGILMFVRPGADFQFSVPNELPARFTAIRPQATAVIDQEANKNGQHLTDITVGEQIASLRPLLHRTSFSFREFLGNNLVSNSTYIDYGNLHTVNLLPRTPLWYGPTTYGRSACFWPPASSSKINCNFCQTHPIPWVMSCFAGYRGSMVIQVNICKGAWTNRIESASLERYPGGTLVVNGGPGVNVINKAAFTTYIGAWAENSATAARATEFTNGVINTAVGNRGMTLTKEITQSALSAVSPQYAPLRFAIKNPEVADTEQTAVSVPTSWFDNFRLDTTFERSAKLDLVQSPPFVEVYYAAGVDFQPVFFVCVPVLYIYAPLSPVDGYSF